MASTRRQTDFSSALKTVAFVVFAAVCAGGICRAAAAEAKPRGMWFWSKPTSAYGAHQVVGNPGSEAEAVETFRRWGVRRLYGSYGAAPVERAAAVGAWNRRLHAAGIRSEALFSDAGAIAEAGRALLLRQIDERVLQFNRRSGDAVERFDGIALDIEPHATPAWKAGTAADRRAMLEEYLRTCAALREFLDANGGRDLAISAALAYWLDRLPPEGRVGWASADDRGAWFTRLAGSVASISLMAYERSRPELILDAGAWERAHFPGRTIIALRARLGEEWKSLADLQRVLPAIEAAGGAGVDLENYELVRAAEAAAERR